MHALMHWAHAYLDWHFTHNSQAWPENWTPVRLKERPPTVVFLRSPTVQVVVRKQLESRWWFQHGFNPIETNMYQWYISRLGSIPQGLKWKHGTGMQASLCLLHWLSQLYKCDGRANGIFFSRKRLVFSAQNGYSDLLNKNAWYLRDHSQQTSAVTLFFLYLAACFCITA